MFLLFKYFKNYKLRVFFTTIIKIIGTLLELAIPLILQYILKTVIKDIPKYNGEAIDDSLEMAIKALEQESCKDAISRAEALEVIKQMDIPEDMIIHIGVEIGTLPPATPKRKVGEWIKKNNDYFDWYECSECGYGSDGEMKYNRLCDVRTKFCPDCGSQNLKGE